MKRLIGVAISLFTWLYCGIAFFDPSSSILGMKLAVFTIILSLFLALIVFDRVTVPKDLLFRVLCIAFVFPAGSIAVFIIRHPGQSVAESLSLVKALLAIVLVLPVVAVGVDLRRPVFLCIGFLALSTIALGLVSMTDPALHERISNFLIDNNVALIGSRSFEGLSLMMIFFVTSPLLVVPVPFLIAAIFGRRSRSSARTGATLFLFLILGASFFSASRALFAIVLLEILVCFLIAVKHRPWLVAGTLVIAAACLTLALYGIRQTSLLSADEQSNAVKIAHFTSFVSFIDEHPAVLLTGDGLGASYVTDAPGVNQEVYQTELTYLDMVRYFGLAGSICFMLLLIVPFFSPAPNAFVLAGFYSYLIVAGSNPLLFNSTGMLAVIFFWSQQFRVSRNRMTARGSTACHDLELGDESLAVRS